MTYYIKGGSKYNEANPNVWVINHLSGYTEADYVDPDWKDLNDSGAIGDPYWRLGGEGGQNWAEIGISGSYGIKITENGISGYNPNNTQWTGLMGGGGGGSDRNVDGGVANSVYLPSQIIDGGTA